MKHITRIFMLYVIGVLVLSNVMTVQAGKGNPHAAPTATISAFGNTGMRVPNETPYLSEMQWQTTNVIGYYVPQGNAFVGDAPALTEIRGSCQKSEGTVPMTATVAVDGQTPYKLIGTYDNAAAFFAVQYGQSFVIRLDTIAPAGCMLVLEKIG